MTGVVAGIPGAEVVVSFLATKLLEFHIAVVDFFGGMKSFMVEIDPYQAWVFGIYFVIIMPLVVGILKRKMATVKNKTII